MLGREQVVKDAKAKLVGPGLGKIGPSGKYDDEIIEGRMSLAYMQGMIYPLQKTLDSDNDELNYLSNEQDETEDPLSMSNTLLPSSIGLSFCVAKESTIRISINAAVYKRYSPSEEDATLSEQEEEITEGKEGSLEKDGNSNKNISIKWQRRKLKSEEFIIGHTGHPSVVTLEENAFFEAVARPLPNGQILLTASICNANEEKHARSSDKILYQVSIKAEPVQGSILKYPTSQYTPPTEEERELRVIYGDQRPYAVGHGTSTDWEIENGRCKWVSTEAIPTAHVWKPIFDRLTIDSDSEELKFNDNDLFKIAPLAYGELCGNDLINRLENLVAFYENWITTQHSITVESDFSSDAKRMIDRCSKSAKRMRSGIQILESDERIQLCFMLANRAMLMSMSHADRVKGVEREDGLQGPFDLGEADTTPIDYSSNQAKWRPFQLAFFLQTLPSLAGEGLPDRELVDVIWFATGGGKTEAYLFLSAFELFRRRIIEGNNGAGTGVINRYTYRFLTADQFQRTAGMICAMELIRRDLLDSNDIHIGEEPFSIGLFVGSEVSPNRFDGSPTAGNSVTTELLDSNQPRDDNPFPIENCPSCGTLLVPESKKILPDDSPDHSYYGFVSSSNSFITRCPEESCEFHKELPVYFIDEQLYQKRPSFLLGTVDKFAMIPFNQDAGALLGCNSQVNAPSLIIQDELHLISGPLGTIAGIYEAAFETLMTNNGVAPKIIASTATIRNSSNQCRRIYGRPSSIFPSPGLRSEDSFFSKLDKGNLETSRLYAGVMPQGLRSTVAVSWTIATLMQTVYELGKANSLSDFEIDSYWTLVAYHNSKRELGRIVNATRDEIPTRIKVYSRTESDERPSDFNVMELKAHSETPVPRARQMLAKKHSEKEPAIDIVPCTNIISVGIDIDRLGYMLVNGQPKLSAEYIQATSRVGRGVVPGLVFTAYSPSKPRDRSHYESFRDYHEKFYSFVEPTSVTPGSLPAIERALHAALVTVIRHGTSLRKNADAIRFDQNNKYIHIQIEKLKDRLLNAYHDSSESEERARLTNMLAQKVNDWETWIKRTGRLPYTVANKQKEPHLLVTYDNEPTDNIGWRTLQSMRHVDSEIILEDRFLG